MVSVYGDYVAGQRDEVNIWGAAQKPHLHAASYALRATSSLEIEFYFLLVATLGGLCLWREFGTCICSFIYVSIYIYICFFICELVKKIHSQLVATLVAGGINQNLEPG